MLMEGIIHKTALLSMPKLVGSLFHGKAALKHLVAKTTKFNPARLPYNEELVQYLRAQHCSGRIIGLFTGADQSVAEKIAAHLGVFSVVRGSNTVLNLKGIAKVKVIREVLGERFSYAGDSRADSEIFAAAEYVVLVGPVNRLLRWIPADVKIEASFPARTGTPGAWFKALRLNHWAKNSLIFLSPFLGTKLFSWPVAVEAVVLFLAMGLLASGTYIINDLVDLEADREHEKKRLRPFASGEIGIFQGALATGGLLTSALVLALTLPSRVFGALTAYFMITLAYSFWLKRRPMTDVLTLAGLFTIRVLAGSLLVMEPIPLWLLTFTMMFFLGLAMVKRYVELQRMVASGKTEITSRGYTEKDLPLLLAAGVAAGLGAVIIFMIYMITEQFPRQVYNHPELLWATMPVILIWTLRIWHFAVHGRMTEDPVVFALKDPFSLAMGLLLFCILLAAWT
jgi:4-hydroxybenzoate polyprenyltransferase